jgi:hypothetical protein
LSNIKILPRFFPDYKLPFESKREKQSKAIELNLIQERAKREKSIMSEANS